MLPSAFVNLDQLPVTTSGKLDRRALPAPPSAASEQDRVIPSTALEASLVAIWQRILHVETLGVDRSFFELGGHSLLATQVVSRVQAELGLELACASCSGSDGAGSAEF